MKPQFVKAVSILFLLLWCCGKAGAKAQSKEPPLIHVVVEFIEVEHLDYSDWLLENRIDHDATDLRASVQEWISNSRGKVIETAACTVASGKRGKTQSGKDYIFPTEFDPPKVPKKVVLSGKETVPITREKGADPETRYLGTVLEIHPFLDPNQITIDLHLAPSIVKLKHKTQWPSQKEKSISSVEMPIFQKMKVTTMVSAYSGHYTLLGTNRPLKASDPIRKNPLILQFVRADIMKKGDESVEKQ